MKYPKHILQSQEWANFREKWGTKVVKAGKVQFTIHSIPHLPWKIGYMPRPYPQDINWDLFKKKAIEEKCVFVKIEPNSEKFEPPKNFMVVKGERMFAYATYLIDFKKSEEELLKNMHPKTRYNIKLATKRGVEIKVGNTKKMLDEFMDLFILTQKRHRVFIHPSEYYEQIFDEFKKNNNAQIITGYYNKKALASMMLLTYEGTLFYPYGGSTHLHKDVMAFYLVMWNAILYGKKNGSKVFDMWNCLPPEIENPNHPWYGFHKFKKGFRGELIKFPGAYDVIFMPTVYPFVILLNKVRWAVLKSGKFLKKSLRK